MGAKMPEVVLAIFGGWVLASMIAGALFVTVRSWLENRRMRSTSREAQVQIARRRPAGTTGELKLVVGDKGRHARRNHGRAEARRGG
jgi:hypothetical protein